MEFTRDGQRLTYMQADKLAAEITFPIVNESTWAVEHIWVNHQLDQVAIAKALLDKVCVLATTENVRLLPLDPFARHHLPSSILVSSTK